MKPPDKRQIVGWIAVALSLVITCLWALWGIIENFHEGSYCESLLSNLGLMIVQYLSPMLLFMAVTLVSIFWPRSKEFGPAYLGFRCVKAPAAD